MRRRTGAKEREDGFTLLEIIIVLFLLGGMLSLIIPRIALGDNLSSVTRKWAGAIKSLQEMAMIKQRPIRLYVDLDQGTYWPMVLEGSEEKRPLDALWATPISLPETIRFADIQIGGTRRDSGRVDLLFYPNGRIDPVTMHLADAGNNVMGLQIEPVTAMVRVTDERIVPPIPRPIPERIRPLLQSASSGPGSPPPFGSQR
ncbi:prepilin-type N-terminal cleavage/methylation domain-containing protein [Petrachloros mirabilis]